VTIADLFLSELDRESARSKKALEQVPEGKHDWKPHDRSMAFGYLAEIVAKIPSWVAMTIATDRFDLNPPGGPTQKREPLLTRAALLEAHEKAVAEARAALQGASEEVLMAPWQLLVAGKVVSEAPRHVAIRDLINHLAHHRGQMTVYLRLLGATVPAIYGPSADDQSFA
jgi:uncharacterized damage-inducible protein DinB